MALTLEPNTAFDRAAVITITSRSIGGTTTIWAHITQRGEMEPDPAIPQPFRQPNPVSATIYIGQTHTFDLGAAIGGNCWDPIEYQWWYAAPYALWDWVPVRTNGTNATLTTPALRKLPTFVVKQRDVV